ncbi:MAG: 30S ribosomal protein S9 [Thermoguttaceae bacterium]|jgi:small subunit ribosomal protein S9
MAGTATLLKGTANDILGTGRRKTAVARVRLRPGQGVIVINGRPLDEYFHNVSHRNAVVAPLVQLGKREAMDVMIRVDGGGITGQSDACKLGIARALKRVGEDLDKLRESGLLTRDGRMKERKKYGLRGARRGTQFSKR